MRIGWVGLGKLGLPCALALAARSGHEVLGYDVSPSPARILAGDLKPHREDQLLQLIAQAQHGSIQFGLLASAGQLAAWADIILVAVQTPHDSSCDGTKPMPAEPQDFNYAYLRTVIGELAAEASSLGRQLPVAVVSTVAPGTMEREIAPLGGLVLELAYSPSFISLGRTVDGFTRPDFHLIGRGSRHAVKLLREVFAFTGAPVIEDSYPTVELAKMACNMQDTIRITYANFLGELAQGTGANADVVTGAMRLHKSGWGPGAGMPDGGPCRPRDLIALSWLARQVKTSTDVPQAIGLMREEHARRIAESADAVAKELGLPVIMAGTAYKQDTDLTDGSPASLVAYFLDGDPHYWDVPAAPVPDGPGVFIICTPYDLLRVQQYPEGSVVIDPWGITDDQLNATVIRVGR